MRSFDRQFSNAAQDPDARKRVTPYLSEPFDLVVFERPAFLAEVGLEPGDALLLRVGAVGQNWLPTAPFYRAVAEEARHRKEDAAGFLNDFSALEEKEQWLVSQRVFLRMEQLIQGSKDRARVASELQIKIAELDDLRKRWKESMSRDDQALSQAIQLRLLGVGMPSTKDLLVRLEAQSYWRFLWFFRFSRPMLTKVSDVELEITTALPSPLGNGKEYLVRDSLAREIEENSHLSPQLWGKQWVDYFQNHKNITNPEFRAVLDHLEQGGRHRWPDMVAVGGARARRAVAAVAVGVLESLAAGDDPEAIQRLFTLIENFSEHHEMKAVLKKRFGV